MSDIEQFHNRIIALREDDTSLSSELALAIGMLLGYGRVGSAAAVAHAYELLYPAQSESLNVLP